MTSAEQLGKGGVDDAGRPIFISTEHTRYTPSENRELTDQEKLAWKSFELWRTAMKINRRNEVYRSVTSSEYTSFSLSQNILGSPYPLICADPSIIDVVKCTRWYEHATSLAIGMGYYYWIKSKASTRFVRVQPTSRFILCGGTALMFEICFLHRSTLRLTGNLPNDYECRKYGVLETKERLEHKKKLWEKYAAYKREWCRRFDYHVYGIRPGENWNLFSSCWVPAMEPHYLQHTDYPLRKNPYFLSSTPLREMFMESPRDGRKIKEDYIPDARARAELKYMFDDPRC